MSTCIFPRVANERLPQLLQAIPEGYDITNKTILDYGGNRGNLLEDGDEADMIDPSNYTSMDVDPDGLEFLQKLYPTTNTIHYDRYNPAYRHMGIPMLPFPQADDTYDIVYSYSVNTHSSWEDYVFDISEMTRVCKPGGLVFTSKFELSCIQHMLDKRVKDWDIFEGDPGGTDRTVNDFRDVEDVIYLVDNNDLLNIDDQIPQQSKYLITYYNEEWLLDQIHGMGYKTELTRSDKPRIQTLIRLIG